MVKLKRAWPESIKIFIVLSIFLVIAVNYHSKYKTTAGEHGIMLGGGGDQGHDQGQGTVTILPDNQIPTILPGHIDLKLPPPKHSISPVNDVIKPRPTDPKVKVVSIEVSPHAIPHKDLISTSDTEYGHAKCISPNPFGPQCTMEMGDALTSCTRLRGCVALICPEIGPYINGVPDKNIKGPICQARSHISTSITTADGKVIDESNHGMCPCTHITFEAKGLISEVLMNVSDKDELDLKLILDGDYLIPVQYENDEFVKRVREGGELISPVNFKSLDDAYIIVRSV
ncbi:hypothetical protein TrST_g13213 [Triparma strigata]|uniref:Uncharacterized protein n=1 Tax=Triparma strigata TaxID=1606541 RepID=A0A9W7BDD8_9STRA|nr:hypothetical protein TrST_g13213 [Triparma strigata]